MIAIEIRSDELRAVLTSGKFGKTEIVKVQSAKLSRSVVSNLIAGDTDDFVVAVRQLLEDFAIEYEKKTFSVVVNLEGIMTQRVVIPKVREKQMPLTLKSKLVNDGVLIEPESTVAFSVLKDGNKTQYNVLSHVISQKVPDNITKAFNTLGIKLKYIDVSPNTIVKVFAKSKFSSNKEFPLQLVVDLSESEVRYYQFENGTFSLNFLDNASAGHHDEYFSYLEGNIRQFKDEYGQYSLDDLEVIVMGEEEIIKEFLVRYDEIFNITRFTDGIPFVKNQTLDKLDSKIDSIGASLRNDAILSSKSKFDVNLLEKKNVSIKTDLAKTLRSITILGLVATGAGVLLVGSVYVGNMKLEKDNEVLETYVTDKQIIAEVAYSKDINDRLKAFEGSLSTMVFVEEYLGNTERPYTSLAIYTLYNSLTPKTTIESLSLSDGEIDIAIRAGSEASFMNYTSRLRLENKIFKNVTYSAYAGSKKDGYTGTINVELVGEE